MSKSAISPVLVNEIAGSFYDPYGRLVVHDGFQALVRKPSKVHEVRPPVGWALAFSNYATPTSGSIVDRPFIYLAKSRESGKLGVVRQDLGGPAAGFTICCPNGRFVLTGNVLEPDHIVRLYDAKTKREFAGSVPRRQLPHPEECPLGGIVSAPAWSP